MTETSPAEVKFGRVVGDMICQVTLSVANGEGVHDTFRRARQIVDAEVAAFSKKHSKNEQPIDDCWFVDAATSESFDCADDEAFRRALNMVLKSRGFPDSNGANGPQRQDRAVLFAQVLAEEKVERMGLLTPDRRKAFLAKLSAGEYDGIKVQGAN